MNPCSRSAQNPQLKTQTSVFDLLLLRRLLSKLAGAVLATSTLKELVLFEFARICKLLSSRELHENARFSEFKYNVMLIYENM